MVTKSLDHCHLEKEVSLPLSSSSRCGSEFLEIHQQSKTCTGWLQSATDLERSIELHQKANNQPQGEMSG